MIAEFVSLGLAVDCLSIVLSISLISNSYHVSVDHFLGGQSAGKLVSSWACGRGAILTSRLSLPLYLIHLVGIYLYVSSRWL